MHVVPSQFEITIEDNGCGFDPVAIQTTPGENGPATGRHGNGLRNMRQRLDILGGQCTIRSRPGHGTTVILSVPLAPATASKANGGK
jgi:signal transduction histidine kinase